VLASLRNPSRYGKSGDFAAWALDSTPEVSNAWEYKNYGVFGALLIQVINGNQFDGVNKVGNTDAVRDYINDNAPPVLFTVRTPEIINLDPVISLPPTEDTVTNRALAVNRMKTGTPEQYKNGIKKLFPQGAYWNKQFGDAESDCAKFVEAKTSELLRFRQRMSALLDESRADTATETIEYWERVLLGSVSAGLTYEQRRALLFAQKTQNINRPVIIQTAKDFGVTVTDVVFPYHPALFGFTCFGTDPMASPAAFSVLSVYALQPDAADRDLFESVISKILLANYIVYFKYQGGATNGGTVSQ
jgi:uncharacterized protein YmfQ (DUF2313 family)